MPPRKRARPAKQREPEPEPEPVAEDSSASDHSGPSEGSNPEEEDQSFRFFNTTFTTFRVSPLFVGQQPLTPAGLETLSRRLRDTLVGDVVRGVQVGLESDATLGRSGALNRVEWRECSMDSILPSLARDEANRGGKSKSARRLLSLELEYEKVTFSALLLPSLGDVDGDNDSEEQKKLRKPPSWTNSTAKRKDKDKDDGAFAHYPLLLTRLPAPLQTVLTEFLSSTFDCRISALHLGTRTLIRSWERWIQEVDPDSTPAKKDIALTFAFDLNQEFTVSQPGLKSLDVTVPAPEIHRFLRAGKKLTTAKPSVPAKAPPSKKRRVDEEDWTWREESTDNSSQSFSQPFTEALARYLSHTLALDIFRPGVRVQRVVCDAFALADGRVKVFAASPATIDAVEVFVRDLLARAEGRAWGVGAVRVAELV